MVMATLRSLLMLCLHVVAASSSSSASVPNMATVSVVSSVNSYAKANDGRCLFTNVSMSWSPVFNDLQCSAKCSQNSNCSMYMVMDSKCYLYAGMRPSFYNAVSYVATPNQCTLYTTGWGQCPASAYTFNDKYYYISRTFMSSTQALAYCLSNNLLMVKIESYAEAWYLGQVVMYNNGLIPIWIGLFGSSYSNNLTWAADGSSCDASSASMSQMTWILRPAYLQAYCYFMGATCYPPFYIYDEYCNSTAFIHYPVCTCQ